jgi:hypothetical protein
MNRLTKICIAVAVVAAVLWISSMDYAHEVSVSKEYQYNVCHRVLARLRQPETKLRGYTMKQGRPRATGIFETNEELVTAALERHNSGKSMRLIAQILKVSHTTIEKIIKENR